MCYVSHDIHMQCIINDGGVTIITNPFEGETTYALLWKRVRKNRSIIANEIRVIYAKFQK